MAPTPRPKRLTAESRFSELVDGWLFNLGATKPAANTIDAYRRDLVGVARRISASDEVGVLHLSHLTKSALREAFASWASDHAGASVLRAHSAWTSFFDFLVAEDLLEGNPMAAVAKPKRRDGAPRAIRDPDAPARLLAAAATRDPRGRSPWPQRDLALVAVFCVTGIREGEAVALGMASIEGPAGARHLVVVGKGNKARSIPVDAALETVLDAYLAEAPEIPGDEAQLVSAVSNLLYNAVKYSESGSSVKVKVRSTGDGWVEVSAVSYTHLTLPTNREV